MGPKKKRKPRKPKPLLAEAGILHLEESFVPPSVESGLLTTVGEKSQALVLAPNYGYGIAMSSLDGQGGQDGENSREKVNGHEEGENNNEETIGHLVRQIGGAGELPLTKGDVVEDRDFEMVSADEDEGSEEDEGNKAKDNEFYQSLGLDGPKKPKIPKLINSSDKNNSKSVEEATPPHYEDLQVSPPPFQEPQTPVQLPQEPKNNEKESPSKVEDTTSSIRDFYKSYTHYYHSFVPDPLSEERIEFGHGIPQTDAPQSADQDVIALAKMAQNARRAREIAAKLASEAKLKKQKEEEEANAFDPLPMEILPSGIGEKLGATIDSTLEQYWGWVKEDPHDFDRWTLLIQYAETTNNLQEARNIYSAFLPLFPYCFGYWKRYAETEKAHHYINRALNILARGLEFIPLSTDLWLFYLNLYAEINGLQPQYQEKLRGQYEKAISAVGMEFRSDKLWDSYIDWEMGNHKLRNVFKIYSRLLQVPTRLYNRHWDNFQALIRDHHPRVLLEKEEYERRRKKGCSELGYKYKEEPEVEPGEIRRTSKPEDRLMAHVKDRIIGRFKRIRVRTETEVNKRWDFEDNIRRPYFHTKALDRKQLKNWEEYLDFEISEKSHDRIVLLFERCLITCAKYERFWCKYARYLENYHRAHCNSNEGSKVSIHYQKSQINSLCISRKETEEEEAIVGVVSVLLNEMIDQIEEEELREVKETLSDVIGRVCEMEDLGKGERVSTAEGDELYNSKAAESLSAHTSIRAPKDSANKNIESSSASVYSVFSTLLYVPPLPPTTFYWQEIVRDVYKRASIVHCPKKHKIRLQWAAFEEELGNIEEARGLIKHVLEWYPNALEGKCQLLELERRTGNIEALTTLYEEFISKALRADRKEELSMLSMKFARFLFKERGSAEKALGTLRKALKRDKGNPKLYVQIYEICYERFPKDRKGALAALELALHCKELSGGDKLMFLKKKCLFLQEHGDLQRYRDTLDELYEIEAQVQKTQELEARWKAFEDRLLYESQSAQMEPFSVPSLEGAAVQAMSAHQAVPIEFETMGGVDLRAAHEREGREMSLAEQYKMHEEERERACAQIPPTDELTIMNPNYGYGSKHPDHKIYENMAQKEYEKLEAQGYSEEVKAKNAELPRKKRNIYIVPPKGDWDYMGKPGNPPVPGGMDLKAPLTMDMLSLPANSPCVNIPDWFVKDGGELVLSESTNGFSIIRYWPHFLSEDGYNRMFRCVRKAVKWHQKQILIHGRWKHIPRLVSWLGPCDYNFSGTTLDRNEDWPHEILDLLHRLNKLTKHLFNSCFLNLYRHGHDSNHWHSDAHPALGANPPVASVSLGAMRSFEMRRRGRRDHNFVRFPLFPGSLLLMEGATQEDWSHQIPKEPTVTGERLNLTFRIMHALEDEEDEEPNAVDNFLNTTGANREKVVPRVSRWRDAPTRASTRFGDLTSKLMSLAQPKEDPKPSESVQETPKDVEIKTSEIPEAEPQSQTKIIFHKLVPNPRFNDPETSKEDSSAPPEESNGSSTCEKASNENSCNSSTLKEANVPQNESTTPKGGDKEDNGESITPKGRSSGKEDERKEAEIICIDLD